MKKILILFTAVCFMFLMAGCGGEDKKAADPKQKQQYRWACFALPVLHRFLSL